MNPGAGASADVETPHPQTDRWPRRRRYFETDSTEPQSREDCPTCAYTRRIVGYRPVGPLAKPKPAPKPKEPPKPPSRRTLTRRLNAAEANVARLRGQLAQAEQEAGRLREERNKASTDLS